MACLSIRDISKIVIGSEKHYNVAQEKYRVDVAFKDKKMITLDLNAKSVEILLRKIPNNLDYRFIGRLNLSDKELPDIDAVLCTIFTVYAKQFQRNNSLDTRSRSNSI